MTSNATVAAEFLIPTSLKTEIASHLSWPFGAKELTQAFLTVPQIRELKLKFYADNKKPRRGKSPLSFPVIAAEYNWTKYIQFAGYDDRRWSLKISAVPRNFRAGIRAAMNGLGFQRMAEWLTSHVGISGCEGYLLFESVWNSETNSIEFRSRDNVPPNLSPTKNKGSRQQDEEDE